MPDFPQLEENLYGHLKKLHFLARELNQQAEKLGIAPERLRVLDVGCGNCEGVTFPLASLGFALTGLDIFEPVIAYAKAKNPYPNLTLRCGELNDLTPDERFEAIVGADFLEHLPHPGEVLEILRERLAPGGILLLSVPNGYGPFEIEKFLTEKPLMVLSRIKRFLLRQPPVPRPDTPYNIESGHLQHFTRKSLLDLLKKHGFTPGEIQPGAWLGANLCEMLLSSNKGFIKWNVEIADKLPLDLVSTWYVKAEKDGK